MYGTTFSRSADAIRHMLIRPRDALRWIGDRLDRRTPIERGLPWISYPCIDYLRPRLHRAMRVFEWGAGGSTLFFVRAGCTVVTVEGNEYWHGAVLEALDRLDPATRRRATVRFVPAETRAVAHTDAYIGSVEDGAPWDLILVDGLDESYLPRMACLEKAVGQTAPGGMIVLDDAWRREYDRAPELLPGHARHEFWGLGHKRWGVTKTDVYRAP